MICFPNAKINIGLRVLEKRNDGYHNIESILYPIKMSDILEVNLIDRNQKNVASSFTSTGLEIDTPDKENLVFKILELFTEEYSLPPVNVHLHKIIPIGSGLGGGSSDVVFTLLQMNEIFNLGLTKGKLHDLALHFGSDCPFFLTNKSTLISGRGEKIQRIYLKLNNYYLVVVSPDIHINTGLAYSQLNPKDNGSSLKELINVNVENWKEMIVNDFEKPVFNKFPQIKKIKEELYNIGAVYSSLTGSGSSVYGLFKEKITLTGLFHNYKVWQEKL